MTGQSVDTQGPASRFLMRVRYSYYGLAKPGWQLSAKALGPSEIAPSNTDFRSMRVLLIAIYLRPSFRPRSRTDTAFPDWTDS